MTRIAKPSPPEHIVLADTNILWHEDKSVVVRPEFDAFWEKCSPTFPMKLILPEVVRGELLFQQTTSAIKLLTKANNEFSNLSRVTGRQYSHRVKPERVKKEVAQRFDEWAASKGAEIWPVPFSDINWAQVVNDAVWRHLPFTEDNKNPKSEKGFRDYMILETVCSVCRAYPKGVNIAFVCGDYALRTATDTRLGSTHSYSSFESVEGFESFIQLTKKNLTEGFVKSILSRAALKFHDEKDRECLIYKNGAIAEIRSQFLKEIENPASNDPLTLYGLGKQSWKHVGKEQAWVTRPQFRSLEHENEYHWTSRITFVRLYTRDSEGLARFYPPGEQRLMVLSTDVHWKAKVRADGRFFDCEIVGNTKADYSFDHPTPELLERYGINTTVTETEQQDKADDPSPTGELPWHRAFGE